MIESETNETKIDAPAGRRRDFLRWVAVAPAALLAGWFFAGSVDFLLSLVGIDLRESAFPPFLFPLIQLLPSGAAFTIAGALTAPNRQAATGSVLAALSFLMAVQIHVLGQPNPGLTNYMHATGQSLGALAGVSFIVRRRYRSAGSDPS